jgi:protein TonB
LLSSVAIHLCVILIGSVVLQSKDLRRQDFFPIRLIDLPHAEAPPSPKVEAPAKVKTRPPPQKEDNAKESPPVANPTIAKQEPAMSLTPAPVKEEPAEALEAKAPTPAKTDTPSSFALGSRVEGGGEASAVNLFGKGDVEVAPGSETTAGVGSKAVSDLGRGSATSRLTAPAVVRTNREAKPIQTARAAYPPMALRMGLESDVTLRIEVDPEGKVTTAEIIKSGGAGFDEEALKAVKQSRFEPAEREGQRFPLNLPTFIDFASNHNAAAGRMLNALFLKEVQLDL